MTEHSNLDLSFQEDRNEAFIKISLVLVWGFVCLFFKSMPFSQPTESEKETPIFFYVCLL